MTPCCPYDGFVLNATRLQITSSTSPSCDVDLILCEVTFDILTSGATNFKDNSNSVDISAAQMAAMGLTTAAVQAAIDANCVVGGGGGGQGGGPYSVQENVPDNGQITVTDDTSSESFVLDINGAIDLGGLTAAQITDISQAIDFTQLTPAQTIAFCAAVANCTINAANVSVVDTGGLFVGVDVEAVLQEIGAVISAGSDGVLTGLSVVGTVLTATRSVGADVTVDLVTILDGVVTGVSLTGNVITLTRSVGVDLTVDLSPLITLPITQSDTTADDNHTQDFAGFNQIWSNAGQFRVSGNTTASFLNFGDVDQQAFVTDAGGTAVSTWRLLSNQALMGYGGSAPDNNVTLGLDDNGMNLTFATADDLRINTDPGISGQVLTSNGINTPPTWEDSPPLIQRGTDTSGTLGVRTVTLPQAFANTDYTVSLTAESVSFSVRSAQLIVGSKTTTSFQLRVFVPSTATSATDNCDWIAIGEV